jgi:cytochrome c oxidase cbb3-type subunit 4
VKLDFDTLVWFSKSFGLFYLIALAIGAIVYAYRPSNRERFQRAADSVLDEGDRPCR